MDKNSKICVIYGGMSAEREVSVKSGKNMADALGIPESKINIKATTEEGLGFTGRGEGIASQAICLLIEKQD